MSDVEPRSMRQRLRVLLFIGSLLFLLTGGFGIYALASLHQVASIDSIYQLKTSKDLVFNLLWLVVMICFVTTGFSMLTAAVKQRMNNIVPGPTLYILGVSLVIIAMFLFSVGSLLNAALIAAVGFFVMWLEYRSTFI